MTCPWLPGLVRGEVEALTVRVIGHTPAGSVNCLKDDEPVPEVEAFYGKAPRRRKPVVRYSERGKAVAEARQRWINSLPHVSAALPMSRMPRLNVTFPKDSS